LACYFATFRPGLNDLATHTRETANVRACSPAFAGACFGLVGNGARVMRRFFESETAYRVGMIGLGLLPIGMVLAVLFVE
jgi:hypothetical protein